MQSSRQKVRHLLQSTTPTRQRIALCSFQSRPSRSGSCLVPLQARRWSCRASLVCAAAAGLANGPKTGLVGPERCKFAGQHKMLLSTPQLKVACYRFQDGALPGTYYGSTEQSDETIDVIFEMDAGKQLTVQALVGSNLLRAAEAAEAIKLNRDFCFEGSCELCQLEVEAGAQELGSKAQPGNQELVRGCLTPIPSRQSGTLHVKVLSEEDVWAQGVL